MSAHSAVSQLIRKCYAAFQAKDRAAIEPLLTEDFTFTSPLDDHIDRAAYFSKCWPNSEHIRAFTIEKLFERGNEAFVLYEVHPTNGDSFRNTEFFKLRETRSVKSRSSSGQKLGPPDLKRTQNLTVCCGGAGNSRATLHRGCWEVTGER